MSRSAKIIDLFCGSGGLSYGFLLEGFKPILGIDSDSSVSYAYSYNNRSHFDQMDIREVESDYIDKWFGEAKLRILGGCAPCQPFSSYNQAKSIEADSRSSLIYHLMRIIEEIRPEIVISENVASFIRTNAYRQFLERLDKLGYSIAVKIVDAYDFGVPQHRKRFTLIASLIGEIEDWPINSLQGTNNVKEAIGNLPPTDAGVPSSVDPMHIAAGLTSVNLRRIRASKPGGTWRDWPDDLVVDCHQRGNGYKYPSIYGRMQWNMPAPTITTQAYNYGSGRFGHPEQDRAITLREAALLQGFPESYQFVEPGHPVRLTIVGRMIGNAVPVPVARAMAYVVKQHLRKHDFLNEVNGLEQEQRELCELESK